MARVEIPIIVLHPETIDYVQDVDVYIDYRTGGEAPVYAAESGGIL